MYIAIFAAIWINYHNSPTGKVLRVVAGFGRYGLSDISYIFILLILIPTHPHFHPNIHRIWYISISSYYCLILVIFQACPHFSKCLWHVRAMISQVASQAALVALATSATWPNMVIQITSILVKKGGQTYQTCWTFQTQTWGILNVDEGNIGMMEKWWDSHGEMVRLTWYHSKTIGKSTSQPASSWHPSPISRPFSPNGDGSKLINIRGAWDHI